MLLLDVNLLSWCMPVVRPCLPALQYAMSVIVGRALPDVRDGLKPVHRRILFAMHELGMTSGKPHRKCAGITGQQQRCIELSPARR